MKALSPRQITYIVGISLLMIFSAQFYLVYEYFKTTREALVRESDTIIEEAFKKDLELRHRQFNFIEGKYKLDVSKPSPIPSRVSYDFSKRNDYADNMLGLVDLAINNCISNAVPIKIQQLDSLTSVILKTRNINSGFSVSIIDPTTGKTLQKSHSNLKTSSLLVISSKYLTIDIVENKALLLELTNPFGLIIQRMGFMLLSSLVFSIICLLAFRILLGILAKQKQLVAFKNDFLANIAHELKRPVASLSFNLDCLKIPEMTADPDRYKMIVNKSINATTEINSTINMIVALAKLEEGLLSLNPQPIHLKTLFDDLKSKFMESSVKQLDIKIQIEGEELNYIGDVGLLTQCFANLIDNSIKYSNNEVLIVITVSKSQSWLVVSVRDNGLGIPEDKLHVIFDKYTQVSHEAKRINGFGIGLNYVKTIVEKHKGEIRVNSKIGEGTEFNVLLPV
ncbi:MAG: HAMP domain-containing histidine kinase [Paludibacter sp.]|nr:HAMP domain-containing histidine kinase [Paludibacter sp.]